MNSQNINWRQFQPENYRWDFTFQDDDLITGFKIIIRNDNITAFKTIYTLSLLEMKNGSDVDREMKDAICNYNRLKVCGISQERFEEATFFFENHYAPSFIYGEHSVILDLKRFNNNITNILTQFYNK